MSCHVARIKNIVYRKTDELLENLKNELKHPDGNLVDIRECEVKIGATHFSMLRCFVQAKDSGVFVNVGWVVNDRTEQCLLCRGFFTFFNRRHHCRACGSLVCRACSPNNAYIITMEQFGVMKVCRECYRGQGEPVPVLNTRHLGRSMKPQPKGGERTASSSKLTSSNFPNHYNSNTTTVTVPSSTMSSPVPPITQNTTASSNKSNSATPRDRTDSDSYLTPPPFLSEFPLPGYVVKTRRYSTNEKVFINICHHPSILDPMLSLFNVVLPPDEVTMHEEEHRVRMNAEYRDITTASSLDSTIVPILYLNEEVDATQDKEGHSSVLYWVMISSEYFKTSTMKYTSVAVVQKVIEAINKTFQDTLLEDEYVRPRVKGSMKAGVKTCHPLHLTDQNTLATVTTTTRGGGTVSFPNSPITFLAPIRFMLNTVDVALLLRINQNMGQEQNRVSFEGDNRSVYTERTAKDLELARDEDETAQRKTFQMFFNPLPPFPKFQNMAKRPSTNSLYNTDTRSEVSDLTFVSYNPHQPNSKLPKSVLPPAPISTVNTRGTKPLLPIQANPNKDTDITTASETDPINHPHKRFGWLAASNDAKFGPNGRDLLTASMLVYHKDMSLTDAEVTSMMQQAAKLPAVLMGWQIKLEIPPTEEDSVVPVASTSLATLGQSPTPTWMIFVVTGIRKNAMRKTEFRISSLLKEDQWILLKRSDHKIGYDFRPLRQVLSFPK